LIQLTDSNATAVAWNCSVITRYARRFLFAKPWEHARFADLDGAVVQRAKVFVLDSLGVGIAGSSTEGAERLLSVAAGWSGAPGPLAVPVWGRSARFAAPVAAFLNAWQMHNQEYDCLHEGAVVHALATVLPAALAAAELRGGASGTDLITALSVGVDIAAGLGLASRAGFRFFRPATAGGFGAVAAVGRLLGFDRPTLEAAFAWQLAQASGTMQAHVEGSPYCRCRSPSTPAPRCNPASWHPWASRRRARCSRVLSAICRCSRELMTSLRCSTASAAPDAWPSSATSPIPPGAPPMAASKA